MSVSEGTTNKIPCYFVDLYGDYTIKFSKKDRSFLGADDVHLGEWITYERKELSEFLQHHSAVYKTAVKELNTYISKTKNMSKSRRDSIAKGKELPKIMSKKPYVEVWQYNDYATGKGGYYFVSIEKASFVYDKKTLKIISIADYPNGKYKSYRGSAENKEYKANYPEKYKMAETYLKKYVVWEKESESKAKSTAKRRDRP